jgi:hypothetical protein
LRPEDGEQAQHLAMVVDQIFSGPAIRVPNPTDATLLETIKAGIAGQLAPLGDAELTGTRKSSAELLRVQGPVLAEKLTDNLLRKYFAAAAAAGR